MSRIAYVDGQYLPHRAAGVHIGDKIGDGAPGPLSRRLREFYLQHVMASI
jgi:hypothetical protein